MTNHARLIGFEKQDPDEFANAIAPVAPGINVEAIRGTRCGVKVKLGELPGIGLFGIRASNLRVQRPSDRYVGITIPERGGIQCVDAGKAEEYDASSAHVLAADRPFDLRIREPVPLLVANFDIDMLRRCGTRLTGGGKLPDLVDQHRFQLASPAATSFRRIMQFVLSEMDRRGSVMQSPEVLSGTADLLRDSLLHVPVFDAQAPRASKHGDWLGLVRRAEEFVDANLQRPISTSELAATCGVDASTLQRAFQRKYGFGPHAYVKLHRLDRVRAALRQAVDGATVTDVATRYGFFHLSQFAADYRRQFGELPSQTLRSSRSER